MQTLKMNGIEFKEGHEYILLSRESFELVVAEVWGDTFGVCYYPGHLDEISSDCFTKNWEFVGEL